MVATRLVFPVPGARALSSGPVAERTNGEKCGLSRLQGNVSHLGGKYMRYIDKIATIWCIVALVGIFICLTTNLAAFYLSGAHLPRKNPDFAPVSRNESLNVIFGLGSHAQFVWSIMVLWMFAGTISVLFLGFYFAITATGTLRRLLAALCFSCPWILLIISRMPRLFDWFFD